MLSIWKIVKDNLKHVLIGEQRKEMVEHTAIFIEFELCFYMNFKKKKIIKVRFRPQKCDVCDTQESDSLKGGG